MATPTSNPPPGSQTEPPAAEPVRVEGAAPAAGETPATVTSAAAASTTVTSAPAAASAPVSPPSSPTPSTTSSTNGRAGGAAAQIAASPPPAAVAPAPSPAPAPAPAPAPSPRPGPLAAPGPAAGERGRPDLESDAAFRARTRSRRKRFLLLIPILVIAATAATLFGYRYWYQNTYFVWTENASVTGDLVQVGSLNAGRIVATRVDVGRPVREGQEIAVVAMPQEMSSGVLGAAPRMGITGTSDALVPVYSPLNGIVAARMGHVGGTVTAGQPIYSLVDPNRVWIRANIEEAQAWRLEVGQLADVHVDALNRDFVGQVDAITPASAATFSLLPANNASGNFTKVTQYVPVKIVVDTRGLVLPLGTSVEVRIRVREPGSEFPLPWQP